MPEFAPKSTDYLVAWYGSSTLEPVAILKPWIKNKQTNTYILSFLQSIIIVEKTNKKFVKKKWSGYYYNYILV